MELQAKLETIVDGVKSQTQEVEAVKTELADLRDAFQGLKAANDAEIKAEPVDMKAKFYDEVKNYRGETELVKEGQIKAASFNVADEASAGAGVIVEVNRKIVASAIEESALVKLFGRETASSTKYEKRKQIGLSGARWEGENVDGVNGAHTDSPKFTTLKAKFGKAIAKPVITQEALSDPFFNAEAFLMNDVRKQLGRLAVQGLVSGAGDNQPEGFTTLFTAEQAKVDAGTHFKLLANSAPAALVDTLQAMQFELKTGYLTGAKYVMSRDVYQVVAGLKDTTGRPLMQTSLVEGVAGRIFGFDIVVDATLTGVVYFGQFDEAFKVVEIPTSLEMLRNPYKIDFCVEFTVATRIGSIVNDNEAVVGMNVVAVKTK
ncbi:phage major capsid protein [Photobacterium swingsii]|uniref:phage major capsid protein n=1 Tax=Photobacterium swingsii TaxID=680026 RepID=UPI003D100DB4